MEPTNTNEKKRVITGIIIGIIMLILSAGASTLAFFMVGIMVFGCVKSPPEWIYTFVLVGFPIPLIIATITVPYLYIKRQRVIWMIFTPIAALSMSCIIFFIWFLILTQYC